MPIPSSATSADEVVPDEDAQMIDVMLDAQARGKIVITNGRQILIASTVRDGFHRLGGATITRGIPARSSAAGG